MTDLFLGYPDKNITSWIKENCVDYTKIPFYFENIDAENTFNVYITRLGNIDFSLLYSFDNKTWNDWNENTTLQPGQKLYLKAKTENQTFYTDTYSYIWIRAESKGICNRTIAGNIMSLLYNDFENKTEIITPYCFYGAFSGWAIHDSSNFVLPATKLANNCYTYMFMSSDVPELHYPKSLQNDSTFTSMSGSPQFGATNATVYFDI